MIDHHFQSPYDEVVLAHLMTIVSFHLNEDYVEAYSYQSNLVQAIVRMLQS
jgi:hypothetical protein